jgi:hypothetical protein
MGAEVQRAVTAPQSAVHSVPRCSISARLVTVKAPPSSSMLQEDASKRSQLDETQVSKATRTSTLPSGCDVKQREPESEETCLVASSWG